MLRKVDRQLFHTIETDGRQAGAKQQMFLTYTIAFCHAWPILLFGFHPVVIPLLISLSNDGFLRSGVTNECLKSRWKLPVDKERLTIFVMTGTRMDAQSFSKEVGIGSVQFALFVGERL